MINFALPSDVTDAVMHHFFSGNVTKLENAKTPKWTSAENILFLLYLNMMSYQQNIYFTSVKLQETKMNDTNTN